MVVHKRDTQALWPSPPLVQRKTGLSGVEMGLEVFLLSGVFVGLGTWTHMRRLSPAHIGRHTYACLQQNTCAWMYMCTKLGHPSLLLRAHAHHNLMHKRLTWEHMHAHTHHSSACRSSAPSHKAVHASSDALMTTGTQNSQPGLQAQCTRQPAAFSSVGLSCSAASFGGTQI